MTKQARKYHKMVSSEESIILIKKENVVDFFDNEKNVEDYIKMAEGYDGHDLIPILRKHLHDGSSVLELGMGPGKDFELLSAHFQITGSDSSYVFLDRFQKTHPDADLLLIDAATLDTKCKFDGIYSNKVLIHLTKSEVKASFRRQAEVLKDGGIAFHTVWYGDVEEEYNGLHFIYYTPETLTELIGESFEIIETSVFSEMEEADSFYILLRKKQ